MIKRFRALVCLTIVFTMIFNVPVVASTPQVKENTYNFKAFMQDSRFEVDCILTADPKNLYDLFLDVYLGEDMISQFPITHRDGLYFDRHFSFDELKITKSRIKEYRFVLTVRSKDWKYLKYTKSSPARIIYDWNTQKILEDIDFRLDIYANTVEEERLMQLRKQVVAMAEKGTPYLFAQDKVMGQLHDNAKIGYEKLKWYKQYSKNWKGDLYIWFVNQTENAWDYKRNSDWQIKEEYVWSDFNDGEEKANWRNWVQWMYFDGMLISADDFGNINLGYIGRKIDFNQDELCYILIFLSNAGKQAEGIPVIGKWARDKLYEDPKDTEKILYGILMANKGR